MQSTIIAGMAKLTLASEFEAATESEWRALAAKAIGGAGLDTLRTPLYEGFASEPLYLDEGLEVAGIATSPAEWHPIQRIAARTPAGAKQAIEDDLDNGVVRFWLGDEHGAYVPQSAAELRELFGPRLQQGEVTLHLGGCDMAMAALFAGAAGGAAAPGRQRLRGSAGLDPLAEIALSGEIPADRDEVFAGATDAAFFLAREFPHVTPYLVSDRAWHEAGGSAVHELSFALAAAVSYWRELSKRGMPVAEGARLISFALAAGPDLFLTVAKFRAIRALWARALDATHAGQMRGEVFAYMPQRSMSEREPELNLLRGSAAAFAGAIGGADGVVLSAFDGIGGEPTQLSHRLARNTSFILRHEAQIGAVTEAGRGSFYIEEMTSGLCASAWALFREVEAEGGLLRCLETGFVSARIGETSARRALAVRTRADKITGVSAFANLDGTTPFNAKPMGNNKAPASPPVAVPLPRAGTGERFAALVAMAREGRSLSDLRALLRTPRDMLRKPLPPSSRQAAPFELLRRRSDLALRRVGSRPPLFIATLGGPDGYISRANWVRGFFAAGGIEALMPDSAAGAVDGLIEAFKESPAPAACLCGSNAAYAAVTGAAARLKAAGAIFIYLAAAPPVLRTMAPGDVRAVDRLIYDGCDALGLLEEAHEILRVEELSSAAGDDEFAEDMPV